MRPYLEFLENRLVPTGIIPTGLAVVDLTSESISSADLVAELLGNGVSIGQISYQGASSAAGIFSGGTGIIGFEDGIILSTGQVQDVIGEHSQFASTPHAEVDGDSDLDALLPEGFTQDAAVLEFDFTPDFSSIAFQYVFASEEYNAFVGEGFNDVFGFFVNGVNVALIPGTQSPVSINTVNLESNSTYYIDNENGPEHVSTRMNGLTTVLTAVANVNPGQVNHIKLVIGDVGDSAYDSVVFLKASSFIAATAPELTGPDNQSAVEGTPTTISLGEFTDDGGGPWHVAVNWGDGLSSTFVMAEPGDLGTLEHTYLTAGTATVTLIVTDQANNLFDSTTFTIDIENVAPSVGPLQFAIEQSESVFTNHITIAQNTAIFGWGGFTDPGDDFWTVYVNYGDGTTTSFETESTYFSIPEHTYAGVGNFIITVNVTDDDLDIGTRRFIVNVLTLSEFNNVGNTAVSDLSAGGSTTLSSELSGSKVSAAANIPTGTTIENVTVSLANYVGNPTNDGSGEPAGNSLHGLIPVADKNAKSATPVAFFDVRADQLASIPGASLTVSFFYTLAADVVDEVVLYFWDGAAWQKVLDGRDDNGDGIGDEPKKAIESVNPDGTITRSITLTYNEMLSNPLLSQLHGTVFTVAAPVPTSTTTVATISNPFTFASNAGQNTFTSDASQFGRTAAFTSNSTTTLSLRVSQEVQTSLSRSVVERAEGDDAAASEEDDPASGMVRMLLDWLQEWLPPAMNEMEQQEQADPAPNGAAFVAPPPQVPLSSNPAEVACVTNESAPQVRTVLNHLDPALDPNLPWQAVLAATVLTPLAWRTVEIARAEERGKQGEIVYLGSP